MAKTRLNKLHICGPGLSVCCSVISVWGIIMLVKIPLIIIIILIFNIFQKFLKIIKGHRWWTYVS